MEWGSLEFVLGVRDGDASGMCFYQCSICMFKVVLVV